MIKKKKTKIIYVSMAAVRKIAKKQRELQKKEFEKKGKKANKVYQYQALDALLRGVK
jgi:hypothetical protein